VGGGDVAHPRGTERPVLLLLRARLDGPLALPDGTPGDACAERHNASSPVTSQNERPPQKKYGGRSTWQSWVIPRSPGSPASAACLPIRGDSLTTFRAWPGPQGTPLHHLEHQGGRGEQPRPGGSQKTDEAVLERIGGHKGDCGGRSAGSQAGPVQHPTHPEPAGGAAGNPAARVGGSLREPRRLLTQMSGQAGRRRPGVGNGRHPQTERTPSAPDALRRAFCLAGMG